MATSRIELHELPDTGDSRATTGTLKPSLAGRLFESLRRRRRRLDDILTRRDLAHTFSLSRDRLHRKLLAAINMVGRGDCLDAGSGRSPYKRLLKARADSLTSVDIEDRAGEIDFIADIQDLSVLDEGKFDTVLCSQVLEHVPRPWDALSEFARVLRPGGRLILSVPHLSMIHEAPHDYYRYTQFGLRSLCERAGLKIESIEPTGGMFCFLSHNATVVLMSTVGSLPGVMWPAWLANYLVMVRMVDWLDSAFGLKSIYPCDYVVIARKPEITE